MNTETTKREGTLIKVSPAEIAKQQAGATTLTVEETAPTETEKANQLPDLAKRLVELMGVDLKGKTIEQIDAIDQAIRVVTASIRSVKMADYAVSLDKRAEQKRKTAKVAQGIAQKEALDFYAEERFVKIQVCKVLPGKKDVEIEAEGSLPLKLIVGGKVLTNPEPKELPVHTGTNKEGNITQTRGNHLELRNDNATIAWKDNGIFDGKNVANFAITLKIGKKEFVEYRKAKAEKMPTDVTISTKGQRQEQKQRLANKADKLQTAVKITPLMIKK